MKKILAFGSVFLFILCSFVLTLSCSKDQDEVMQNENEATEQNNNEEKTNSCYRIKIMNESGSGYVQGLIIERPENDTVSIMPIWFLKKDFPEWNYTIGDILDIHIVEYEISGISMEDGWSYWRECQKVEPCK